MLWAVKRVVNWADVRADKSAPNSADWKAARWAARLADSTECLRAERRVANLADHLVVYLAGTKAANLADM